MSKTRLIKRLTWYYPLERFHAFVTFPALLIYLILSFPIKNVIFVSYGLIICVVILYQGQHYWKLKLKSLKGERLDRKKQLKFFGVFKTVEPDTHRSDSCIFYISIEPERLAPPI